MIALLIKKIFGSRNDRHLKRIGKLVKLINDQEDALVNLTDEQLRQKTDEFKQRYQKGESLDLLLPEAFSVVREASKRCMGMRHFDVQLIGGMTLHEGNVAEMRTGEGKTLMATLPAYLNALSGEGVHVVTVNDYLAKRDASWMQTLYEFLGLTVGVVVPNQSPEEKLVAYKADITYGTNNEFGFDYLRDNMSFRLEDKAQRSLNFAIVDEVDSILIDEARTPLIISGPAEDSSQLYMKMNQLIPKLERQVEEVTEENPATKHFTVDEKTRQVELTEIGHQFVENLLQEEGLLSVDESLYASHNLLMLHHVNSALKAHVLFTRNVEYIVQNQDILLIDEHTGRTLPGRRLSEGLHQALEAKENVHIQPETQTLASTTFQNYFRIYKKLSGMTGTADTEAFELNQIYGLDVIVIPTHKAMIRKDNNDLVYLTIEDKYEAIIEDIKIQLEANRPILVGTASIESSEHLSQALKKANIKHSVLNAKYHDKEAEIIAQAGQPGAITIATNMAGRGTDIILGGNWQSEIDKIDKITPEIEASIKKSWKERHNLVLQSGGLHIIGTERHESRRIDNQLRGRSGRQGDPGSSRFYLSLEDNLMRIFASERVKNFMKALGMEKGEAIEHKMVSNAIEKAQRKVEGRNFDIRKQLLEYDDVANEQRKLIYKERDDLLEKKDVRSNIVSMRASVVDSVISNYIPPESLSEQWKIVELEKKLQEEFAIELPIRTWLKKDEQLEEEGLREKILDGFVVAYKEKEGRIGQEQLIEVEKHIVLRALDEKWKEHLAMMDHLRQGIHLRGYAQKNPKQEYKREAFELFQYMLQEIKLDTIRILCKAEIQPEQSLQQEARERAELAKLMQFQHDESNSVLDQDQSQSKPLEPFVREGKKIGRNELCPCGSKVKYKLCHGRIT